MDAKLLYEKCLSIEGCSVVDNKKKAIFHSNLSLVENKMGEFEKAREAASAAVKEDSTYVKAWWRLGQSLISLHRLEEALEACSKAQKLDPSNNALKKLVEKTKQQVEEEKASMMEVDDDDADKKATKSSTSTPAPKLTKTTTTTVKSSSSSTKGDSSKKVVENDDDANLFTKSEPVRGYKVVNGKKTSYFHNELDEKSKALIGDIAPKKIENLHPNPAPGIQNSKIQGTSAWNQNGVTWEERDVTKW